MLASSKWIEGTTPEQRITEVVRRALSARLEAVWDYIPLAARKWEEDVEYVHQLRVAARRTRAASRIFADLLPIREARWMKKRLRGLRHAAGDARDLDVLGPRNVPSHAEENTPNRWDRGGCLNLAGCAGT